MRPGERGRASARRVWLMAAWVLPAWLSQAQCTAGYSDAFAWPGIEGSNSGALAAFDDGSGSRLFAGTYYGTSRWNGIAWTAMTFANARAFAVFDDGNGPALYAGFGTFFFSNGGQINYIGRWNGSGWSPLGTGVSNTVSALAVFDDGTGPALYVGGSFGVAGGVGANRLARWNGSAWSEVGGGIGGGLGQVSALTAWDDGSGPALYVMGPFAGAGGILANGIARWNGSTWSGVGGGFVLGANPDTAIAFDDGSGSALYVGGNITTAGGIAVGNLARWNGVTWSAAGSFNGFVKSLAVWDDGGGSALYAAGAFNNVDGIQAPSVARYHNGAWTTVGGGLVPGDGHALTVYDDGGGPALYALGTFRSTAIGEAARGIARWNGASWSALPGNGLDGKTRAFCVADLGGGPALYAGGDFTAAGGAAALRIGRFHGAHWSALGSGIGPSYASGEIVNALCTFDDGTGPGVVAGGAFATAGGIATSNIARWNGSAWSALSGGVSGTVRALAAFDDGSGPALFAGGSFLTAGGAPAPGIAKWNGQTWAPVASPGGEVYAFHIADLGSGPTLFAAGSQSGGGFVGQIIGGALQPFGVSQGGWYPPGSVLALASFDDGTGTALYAGGWFSSVNGIPTGPVAKWNGSWTAVTPPSAGVPSVEALAAFDDGSGLALYAEGAPVAVQPNVYFGRLVGSGFVPVDGGVGFFPFVNGFIGSALQVHDDGAGPALYVGGPFQWAGGIGSKGIAKWGPLRPGLEFLQSGPGAGVAVRNTWLLDSREYYNIFSDAICGPPGGGPYLGLCGPDPPSLLVSQFLLPVGTPPFHFIAPLGTLTSASYQLPAGMVLDAICFDFSGGILGCVSNVARFVVQ